jgi:hypothetical protein
MAQPTARRFCSLTLTIFAVGLVHCSSDSPIAGGSGQSGEKGGGGGGGATSSGGASGGGADGLGGLAPVGGSSGGTSGVDAAAEAAGVGGGGSGGYATADASGREGAIDVATAGTNARDASAEGGAFVHPGILHTQADLDRMKSMVAAGVQPYANGYNVFRAHPQSASNYVVRGGCAEMGRNPDVCNSEAQTDVNAAYQNAVMWAITENRAFANKSIEILNTWSSNLRRISGADAILAAGIYGFKLVNAAEILRYTNAGWASADILRAANLFRNVFYPVIQNFATFANGNWSGGCIKTMMAIGVFTDDQAMFNRAVDWFYNGTDNGRLTNYVINEAGEAQESGRDQTHTQLGLAFLAEAAQIGYQQGLDMFGAVDNRLLKGFEYTASYNLGNNVPFQEYTDTTGKYHQTVISPTARGQFRPVYEMVYNHYKVRRGIDCPFTQQVAARLRPEGAAFQADHPGFGTLLFTLPGG